MYAFKLKAAVAQDDIQLHTYMCYCDFNNIINSITALDADVIAIKTSRSDIDLLEIFKEFEYPNKIGPGVYDTRYTERTERRMDRSAAT